jgi:hypothetical protein
MPSLSAHTAGGLRTLNVEAIPVPFQDLGAADSTSLATGWQTPRGLVFQIQLTDRVALGRQLIAEDIETYGPIPAELHDEIRARWPD